jgi:hypothetical protein
VSNTVKIIAGAALLAFAAYVGFSPAIEFTSQAVANLVVSAGAGMLLGGIGTLLSQKGQLTGTSGAIRSSVSPWNVIYGRAKVGGTIIYFNSFGDENKYLDIVIVLACHRCLSVDALLFDNQRVLIDENGDSFSPPSDDYVPITSITRTDGIVTVVVASPFGSTEDGDTIEIGAITADPSLMGKYVVDRIDDTTFRYICGGLDASVSGQGTARAVFADYGSKVHMEVLLGDQTATFPGMINGTPDDGNSLYLVQDDKNPWTAQHVLYGRTAAFLRLHYNDQIFSNGLPVISFRMHGKTDIYDPRESVVLERPTLLMNGWGPNAHEGAYEMGVDQGYGWGLNDDTTYTYGNIERATEGDQNTFSEGKYEHTHKYAGAIWTFAALGATPANLYLNVLSDVPMGPGGLRSAGIWYSLDGGATWTQIYNQPSRGKQWDNVHLSSGQDATQVQVMAFLDAHDDMWHRVYDISLSEGPATSGYTENAVLIAADYLSNAQWGFRAAYGSEIPLPELIAGANICDELVPLAAGGSEARYTANGTFPLSMKRGEIMQNLLTACGGRLTYAAGQFVIHPASWTGPSITIGTPPPASAKVFVVTANVANSTGSSGIANAGITDTPLGGSAINIIYDDTLYSKRTDSMTLPDGTDLSSLQVYFRNFQTLFVDLPDPCKVFVYDCWLEVTYPDASTAIWRPTVSEANIPNPAFGNVLHEERAIDSDGDSYAEIDRIHFAPLADYNVCSLLVSGFVVVSGTGGGVPDTTEEGMAASAKALAIAAGPFQWKSKLSARDLYNGVKGTYVSPVNDWQASDIPPYAQDEQHGYASDANLIEDGNERRWLDVQFPFTISSSTAQRLAKIELLRRRQQGTGTFVFNLAMYKATVLDIVEMTFPFLGWSHKLLEVVSHRFTLQRQSGDAGNEATLLGTEIDLQETSPSIYAWDPNEELTPQGFKGAVLPSTRTALPPDNVTATSGSSTSVIGADGIARSRILTTWARPADGYVLNGGHMEVQYQKAGDTAWTGLPSVDPSVTQLYIDGVTDGASYVVQVRSVNAAGVPSEWVAAAPVTVSGTATILPPSSIGGDGASSGDVLVWDGSAWVATATTKPGTIGLVIDGGGSVPTTGAKGLLQVPFAATITGWTLLADVTGSAQITVSKGTYAAFPTVTSIVASAPPVLSSAQKSTSTALTGWTTAITAGDVLSFNLDSVTTCKRLTLELQITRT